MKEILDKTINVLSGCVNKVRDLKIKTDDLLTFEDYVELNSKITDINSLLVKMVNIKIFGDTTAFGIKILNGALQYKPLFNTILDDSVWGYNVFQESCSDSNGIQYFINPDGKCYYSNEQNINVIISGQSAGQFAPRGNLIINPELSYLSSLAVFYPFSIQFIGGGEIESFYYIKDLDTNQEIYQGDDQWYNYQDRIIQTQYFTYDKDNRILTMLKGPDNVEIFINAEA